MAQHERYISDNFFSAGRTDIYNEEKHVVGSIDLKSMFGSSCHIENEQGEVLIKGKFSFMGRWNVMDGNDEQIGSLKQKLSFFSKKYEYTAFNRGVYTVYSEAFSKEYTIISEQNQTVASFKRINGFFSSSTYRIVNHSDTLSIEEVIAIVMGVNEIQKNNTTSVALI